MHNKSTLKKKWIFNPLQNLVNTILQNKSASELNIIFQNKNASELNIALFLISRVWKCLLECLLINGYQQITWTYDIFWLKKNSRTTTHFSTHWCYRCSLFLLEDFGINLSFLITSISNLLIKFVNLFLRLCMVKRIQYVIC